MYNFEPKMVIRIITNSTNRHSCKDLFKKLDILPFHSKYIFSLLIFVIDNTSLFKTNSELYDINIRNKNNFHLSQPRLLIYRNGVYYMCIKAFNDLTSYIKELSDDKIQFKNIQKKYLLSNSFYSLKDFLMVSFDVNDTIGAFSCVIVYIRYINLSK
jgi:hypothetical protein